ncbi:MAG: glycosyltransferase [Candidatus Saccharimonas sp.]
MTIWIDLTDLLNWKGNLTGIQRIQFNISKIYQNSKNDVRFFMHVEQSRSFREIKFNPEEMVQLGIIGEKKMRRSIYRGVLRRVRLLNTEIRVRKKIIRGVNKVERSLRGSVRAPFGNGDIVLVMGSIWLGHFIDDLEVAKDEYDFKLVHFAFDMIPSKFPGFVVPWLPKVFTQYHKRAFSISDGIISISQSTASDIRDFMKKNRVSNSPDIKVVRIGESIDDSREKHLPKLEPGFILSVSTIEARKNHAALFYVVKEAQKRGIKLPKIVIVGRKGWHTGDLLYMIEHDPIAKDAIMIISGADDAKLTWLYRNALFTIFPSFYEGWGMPIAESLAYGKVCIASNTSSMPEIAGDLIDYFSPYDTNNMLESIVQYLDSKKLKEKESHIKAHYKQTSWNDMYVEVNDFIKTVSEK